MTRRFVLVALMAGTAASAADVFTWMPNCGEDWWGTCDNGLPSPDCLFFNNWGRSSDCDQGIPPYPGPADDAEIMGAPVRLEHSFAHLRSLRSDGPFTFVGGSMKVETTGEFFGPMMIENAHFAGGDFTFNGPIEFPPGGQLLVSEPGTFHVRGPFHWHEAGNNFHIDSGAHVIIEEGGNFEINGPGQINTVIAAASFTNRGNINKHGPDEIMNIGVTFVNEGMFDVHGGGLNFAGSGNIFGGMMHLHAPIGMTINGPSSTADGFMLMGEGPCTLSSSLLVNGNAMIRRLRVDGTLTVLGSLFVEEFSLLGGGITVVDGSMESPMPLQLPGGTLGGSGFVHADVKVPGATVSPGQSIGTLHIGGAEPRNYMQHGAGILHIEVGGSAPDQADALVVSGEANLGGTLFVSLTNGFVPGPGDDFTILSAAAVHGRFDVEGLEGGFEIVYGPNSVRVRIPGCPADLTGSSDPNDPAYGAADGFADAADFFYYLDQFVAGNLAAADLTGSSDPNDPAYGQPDGALDAADFFYYLDLFVAGCP